MKEQVIQSRITPPQQPGNIITRESLINSLTSGSDKKVILVTAPAGYGKTTLVSKYAYSINNRFAWYHANKDASSPYVFFSYLIHAINKLKPGFGEEILTTIKSFIEDSGKIIDTHSAIDEIVYMIISEFITAFDEKITLIIDDMHEITDNEWLSYSLNKLFEELPHNLQIIITSRHQPDFNISHLRAKREILELNHKNLVFTDAEIKLLSQELYSLNYSDEEVKYLESSLGGWVTGIHMLIQATNGKIAGSRLSDKFLPDTLFDFFAGEIFEKLEENVQEFLLTTAHLENFDLGMSDYLLEINESEKILSHLSSKNIFIESVQVINEKGQQLTQYNYIQLFRTFLIKKSARHFDEKKIKNIYSRVSKYYSDQNNIEASVDFSILSGDRDSSIKLIKNNFDILFQKGRFEKLWQWVNSFNDNAEEDKHLVYYKGILSKYYLGRLDEALSLLDKAVSLAEKANDKDFLNDVLISRTEILLNQGKFNIAIETLKKLDAADVSPKSSARLFYNLGNAYFYIGDYGTALPYLEKAMVICKENEIDDLLTDVYNSMGNIYINNGEFILSTHYYELTLHRITGIYKKFVVLGNLALLFSRTAKYEKAKEYYEKTYDIFRLIKTPIFEIIMNMVEYTLYFELGDFNTAAGIAEDINKAALKINNITYTYLSYLLLGECNYFLGNSEKSDNYYQLAEKHIDDENESDKAALSLFRLVNSISADSSDKTEAELLKAYHYLDSKNSNYDKVMAEYYLAAYYMGKGLNDTALQYLEKALSLAKEKEYASFLVREYLRSTALFNFAVKNNLYKDVVKNIYLRILDIGNLEWINNGYRNELQNKTESLFDIRMSSFGKLEFTVRGEEVADSKWIRKKRKLILCYLFLIPGHSLSKDKIIDIFFPDTPLESIDNTFHQAISNLRSALKLQQAAKKTKKKSEADTEPDYIIYEGKSLMLNPDYNYFSDIGEFDKLTNKASSTDCEAAARIRLLKNAVELYKGDFLSEYYEPWVENIRDEYRNKFIKYSEILLELLDGENNYNELAEYSSKILNIDKLNGKSYLYLIKSYAKEGKNKQAKMVYDKMVKIYEEELDEKPGAALVNSIKEYITL